mmetsp:Transcript_57671/g.134341  ORF Transcript_57671/g.134341 Transcript_57671/m.134341 type:complete len:206 (+) Transcript_57671:2131-2748(+)
MSCRRASSKRSLSAVLPTARRRCRRGCLMFPSPSLDSFSARRWRFLSTSSSRSKPFLRFPRRCSRACPRAGSRSCTCNGSCCASCSCCARSSCSSSALRSCCSKSCRLRSSRSSRRNRFSRRRSSRPLKRSWCTGSPSFASLGLDSAPADLRFLPRRVDTACSAGAGSSTGDGSASAAGGGASRTGASSAGPFSGGVKCTVKHFR